MMSESDAGNTLRNAARNNELEKVKGVVKSLKNKAVLDSKDSDVSSTKKSF